MGVFRQFPYSNFHEMNMDEIIKIVKNMLEEWAQYYDTWDDWKTQVTNEWSEMQSFINHYFDNLNVQTEINNKITAMVNSGEFEQIVNPYVPPAVSEWLAQHITTPETVVIDDSLTIEGACADAKATGDAIRNLKNNVSAFEEMTSEETIINYPDGAHSPIQSDRRVFWTDVIPEKSVLTDINIPIGTIGSDAYIVVEVWELDDDGDTLNKVYSNTITDITSNSTLTVSVNQYSENKRYVGFHEYNVYTAYRTDQTGCTFYVLFDVSDVNTLQLSDFSTYVNMSLVGGFSYLTTNENEIEEAIENLDNSIDNIEALLTDDIIINYPDGEHNPLPSDRRAIWFDSVPPNSILKEVKIPVVSFGSDAYIDIEIWELQNDNITLNKINSIRVTDFTTNTDIIVPVNTYSNKTRYVGYYQSNVYTPYRLSQTGCKWYYILDVTDINTLDITDLSVYSNMSLVGGFTYTIPTQNSDINYDFFSGWQNGNIVIFGDSTVDGSSTTNHTPNVPGTDRTATDEPTVFTSIVEDMINTFTGGNTRVYNAGFGGQTLNYIVNNYFTIMSAFNNVKSALIVIDANSSAGTREHYEESIRSGLTDLIHLLQNDNIAVAVASPQPMFYFPADNSGLPAINSAGEFAIAVNIGKDICNEFDIPFINLGEITNNIMSSPYFKTTDFYGDRVHFGDGGHKFEGFELYGELIHPIVISESNPIFVNLDSNMGELSAISGIYSSNIDGYRSIVLFADNTRTDVLHRIYVIAKAPFRISGIPIEGWTAYYNVYVDGELYTSNTTDAGDDIAPGCHTITVTPTATEHIVRYSGLIFD